MRTLDADPSDCESVDPAEGLGEDVTFEVGEARVDGDDATVPVTLSDDSAGLFPGELTLDLELVKTDGVWLIDGFDLGSLFDDLPDLSSDLDPDELLSDFPSDFPSDFLSDFDPDDFLSDFPSDFLSDFNPEDFMSDFPTELFTEFSEFSGEGR